LLSSRGRNAANRGTIQAYDDPEITNTSEHAIAEALVEARSIAIREAHAEEVRVREALAISESATAADIAAASEAERLVREWASQDEELLACAIGLGTALEKESIKATTQSIHEAHVELAAKDAATIKAVAEAARIVIAKEALEEEAAAAAVLAAAVDVSAVARRDMAITAVVEAVGRAVAARHAIAAADATARANATIEAVRLATAAAAKEAQGLSEQVHRASILGRW
jgi:hypothetical protein